MNRRSIIQLLIGILASLAGLGVLTVVRQKRCIAEGGTWAGVSRICTGPSGPIDVSRASDVVMALGIALLVAFMLYRASTFASRQSR
jgi:hypothetical protein